MILSRRSARSLRTVRAAVLALGLLVPMAVHAQQAEPQTENALVERGLSLRQAGQNEAALADFRRAYDIGRSPRALAQTALAESALGRWVPAEEHIDGALATTDPWIETRRAQLVQARAAIDAHVGHLLIVGGVPGTQVLVDGQAAAVLPLTQPLTVLPGAITVELRANGYGTLQRVVQVAAGVTAAESFSMHSIVEAPVVQPVPPGATHVAPPPVVPPPVVPPPVVPPPVVPPPVVPPPIVPPPVVTPPSFSAVTYPPSTPLPTRTNGSPLRVVGWVGVGIAAGLAGAGLAAYLVGQGAATSFNGTRTCLGTAYAAETDSLCASNRSTVSTMRTLEPVMFIGAGVVGIGSIILVIAAPTRSTEAPASTRLRPHADFQLGSAAGPLGASVVGTF